MPLHYHEVAYCVHDDSTCSEYSTSFAQDDNDVTMSSTFLKQEAYMPHSSNLIWIDLEMTGLNPEKDHIIEIATIVTDTNLNVVAEGPSLAIHQSDELLNSMDEWNTTQHNSSGLVQRVQASTINEAKAETETLRFLEMHATPGKSPMCGNSIWQDRRFLAKYMPRLEAFFHYRMVDVSTLKELAMRWAPVVYNGVQKESKHLALDDIRDSIAELQYYRDHLLASCARG